jgi:hypothetical protein
MPDGRVGHAIAVVIFTPDCKLLVAGGMAATIKVWDAAAGQALATLEGFSPWSALAASPSPRSIAKATWFSPT